MMQLAVRHIVLPSVIFSKALLPGLTIPMGATAVNAGRSLMTMLVLNIPTTTLSVVVLWMKVLPQSTTVVKNVRLAGCSSIGIPQSLWMIVRWRARNMTGA